MTTESYQRRRDDNTESNNAAKLLNSCAPHLHNLALQLTCPICLGFFTQPMLLPCDHILCNSCVTTIKQGKMECPVCTEPYFTRDKRRISLVENIITIHRNLEAAFCANAVQPAVPEYGASLERHPSSVVIICDNHQLGKRNMNVKIDILNGSAHDRNEEFESSEVSSRIQPLRSLLRSVGSESFEAIRRNINPLVKSSPQSTSDDNGSSNVEGNAQGYKHILNEWNLAIKQAPKDSYNVSRHEQNDYCSSGSENDYAKGSKKQRKSYSGFPKMISKCGCPSLSDAFYPDSSMAPSPQVEITSAKSSSELSMMPKDPNASHFSCAFCQSSCISEVTGSMLHYANGKSVEGDEANCSSVIHVHTKCFEWAPQVYHEGETVKNLEKEVARGAKLKCSRCGHKGAALGCCIDSCEKTYHFPCAVELRSCRWNNEEYLLLCPTHRSTQFKGEKSKPKRTRLRIPTQSNIWKDTPVGQKEWVLCGSGLSTEDKFLLVEFADMADLTVTKFWKPDVTHVIVNTDEGGAYTRTQTVLMAILKGCWVLKIDWIKACMKSMGPVDEKPFEVCLDNQGACNGPKTGRLRALANGPKLFSNLYFYFVGDFLPTIAKDLKDLIAAAGGNVLENKESLLTKASNDRESPMNFNVIIVYNLEVPEKCLLGEGSHILCERLSDAQGLASKVGGEVVGHKWLTESVAGCKLLPFVH